MKSNDKYLLGCLYAVYDQMDRGSKEFKIKVNGEWECVPWKEIAEWIEKEYEIKRVK